MSRASSSTTSSPNVIFPPPQIDAKVEPVDPYARLSFPTASAAQILRAYQRDTSQITRLVDVISELIRSMAGTRWLALRQPIVDLMVKAVYLALTLGRAMQTLGEEYTDILPRTARSVGLSRLKRISTILLLLAPSVMTTSTVMGSVRGEASDTTLSRIRARLADWLQSPIGQSLGELNTIAFLYGGRYLEFGRRVTGLSYMSTTPPRQAKRPSYEPLALLLVIPLITRLWSSRGTRSNTSLTAIEDDSASAALVSPVTQGTRATGDGPNTYLTTEASHVDERQCTLCLEPRGTGEGSGGTVAVTECGHVFCWGCLGGLDKPECPLCRQSLRTERLIAAYNL